MRTTGSWVMEAGSITRPAAAGTLAARLLLLGLFLQEGLHDQEDDGRDDDEIDERPDEVAEGELDASDLEDGLAPVPLRRERADDRHDEVGDERGHQLADGGSDHDRDGQAHDVVLLQKRFELTEHRSTLSMALACGPRAWRLDARCGPVGPP